ncbi:MAG: hypothetical protein HQL31_09610, partial [Planctomycetes bacterium]|nr:hypothetical protein [Planctomycetota bacterium]
QKVKDKFRWHLLATSAQAQRLTLLLREARSVFRSLGAIDTVLDRDPFNMM